MPSYSQLKLNWIGDCCPRVCSDLFWYLFWLDLELVPAFVPQFGVCSICATSHLPTRRPRLRKSWGPGPRTIGPRTSHWNKLVGTSWLEQVGWIKLDQVSVILDQVGSSSKKLDPIENFRLDQLPGKILDQVGSSAGDFGSSLEQLEQVRWNKFQNANGACWGRVGYLISSETRAQLVLMGPQSCANTTPTCSNDFFPTNYWWHQPASGSI